MSQSAMPSPTPSANPSLTLDEIRAQLEVLRARDLPTHGGRTLAYVYDSGLAAADAIGREVLASFSSTNGLDPTAFPSLLAMENDLVGIAGRLVDAPDGFAGVVTSGGTESILLAVLAARDARPDVTAPRMVLPTTAHAAFHKAAHWLGVEPVFVDVDPWTKRAVPEAMAAAIDERTVLVVASAPSYAHGVIDPVEPIAAAAAAAGVRCHVDACIGGWVLPHLRAAETNQLPWTFAVEGVTSLSLDLHKYAYTPKGVSILLHASAALRRTHLFASARWPGYTMLNTTAQSTKSGGPLAAAWAVVHHIGADRYGELARTARVATLALATAVSGIPGLVPCGTTGFDAACVDDRRDMRCLHHRRRDARARVVRPATDALRRSPGHVAPDLQRRNGDGLRADRPRPRRRDRGCPSLRSGAGPSRARGCRWLARPGHPR